MIEVEEAWGRVCSRVAVLPTTQKTVDCAQGHVLAESLTATLDLPAFDSSAVDGYALRVGDTRCAGPDSPRRLSVVDEVSAGTATDTQVVAKAAVRIMTGAPVPSGADAVVKSEAAQLLGDTVAIRTPVSPGQHVRRRGEDVERGQVLLEAGTELTPQSPGLLAASGVGKVLVHRPVKMAILATGSELVLPGNQLGPGQIYEANRALVRALVDDRKVELTDCGTVPDEYDLIAGQIESVLERDLVVVTGGVSVGRYDHVKPVLTDLGVEKVFWRVNMKPGKPIFCGQRGNTWVFGLPGNPLSCAVGFLLFIEPLIRRLCGEAEATPRYVRARLTAPAHSSDSRRTFLTARVAHSLDGRLEVTPLPKQGSAMLKSLAESNGFVVVPESRSSLQIGELADVLLPRPAL